jgi:hypothetical protein
MKRRRVVLLLVLTLALMALALSWSWRPRETVFATPADCLEALREASAAGDVGRYLGCLDEPLRSEKRHSLRPADLQRDMDGVKSWTQLDPEVQGSTASGEVDRVRAGGTSRIRFRLEQSARGWLVVGIDPPKEITPPIPYGTHVSQAPE